LFNDRGDGSAPGAGLPTADMRSCAGWSAARGRRPTRGAIDDRIRAMAVPVSLKGPWSKARHVSEKQRADGRIVEKEG
jgi:hypothetical protein